jgi:UDP-N-acetylglucosamine 2-epimerase (non-hydrolysing)
LQEEAISLGKPTLVLREKTERNEGVWEGYAHLVGTDEQKIIASFEKLLIQPQKNKKQAIYGDGQAAQRIVAIIQEKLTRIPVAREQFKQVQKNG